MGYKGQTYAIPLDKGGLSANPNIDASDPTAMIFPTQNLNLKNGLREKRGGTAKVYTGTFATGSTIQGIYDY